MSDSALEACHASLAHVVALLEKGDAARARMQAVLLGFPEIPEDGMERLAHAVRLGKFNPNWSTQPRGPDGGYRPGDFAPEDAGGAAGAIDVAYRNGAKRSHSGARLVEPNELPDAYRGNLTDRNWVNPTGMPMRGRDAEGSGAFGSHRSDGTWHGGGDWQTVPGQVVNAPTDGVVLSPIHYNGLQGVRLSVGHGTTVELLYVSPTVHMGDRVTAGTPVGYAQDIHLHYPAGTTNHSHVQIKIPGLGVVVNPTPLIPN
jgi:hypothetical protein